MQLHTKNSLVTWNSKVKVCDVSFKHLCATAKKSLLTYHSIRVFALFWALFCFIHHIHNKLTTFTPWLREHKQYSRHLKYLIFCSKFVYCLQFVLVGCSSKTTWPELSYFLLITSCTFPALIHFTNEYSTDSWDANLFLYSKFSRK
jgi:hypothetical protein